MGGCLRWGDCCGFDVLFRTGVQHTLGGLEVGSLGVGFRFGFISLVWIDLGTWREREREGED